MNGSLKRKFPDIDHSEKQMVNKRPNRSAGYQHIFNEISCAIEILESFNQSDGLYQRLNPFAYNEEILDLQEQLKKEFWRVVRANLTPRQISVLELTAGLDGQILTQQEIAKKLGVNQSSVVKSLQGNVDYSKKKNKSSAKDIKNNKDINVENEKSAGVSYGGSIKKLKKLVLEDDKIRAILRRIAELQEEAW